MEEEYRIVNGLKLPPKRHVVVKRKASSSSSVTGTPPTTSIGGNQQSTSSDAQSDQKHELNSALPFGAIRTAFVELKEKSKCKDIVLPEQPEFQKKWAALAKSISEKIGNSPNRYDAIAIIDCTVLGGCEHGALIDKSGIYMVSDSQELNGWLDWKEFIEKAEIARRSTSEISICSQPSVGLDISHCKLTISQTHKLFANVLDKASGGKAKSSQVRAISLKERLRDWTVSGIVYGICALVALAICAGVFPFYHEFKNGPDDTIDKMFTSLAFNNCLTKVTKVEVDANDVFEPWCESKEVATQITVRVGLLLVPIIGNNGEWEYDIIKTNKNGDSATVTVKLYNNRNNKKSVVVDFMLKKVKEGDILDRYFGRWVLHSVERGK